MCSRILHVTKLNNIFKNQRRNLPVVYKGCFLGAPGEFETSKLKSKLHHETEESRDDCTVIRVDPCV